MKRKSRGQSMVEFALVFPLIMALLFAGIDFGYYIFAWSEIQFGARRGAEQASKIQPRQVLTPTAYQTTTNDPCLRLIFRESARSGALSAATSIVPGDIFISFYATSASNSPILADNRATKAIGKIVEVNINKTNIAPLTPVLSTLMNGQNFRFNAFSRRTIISNGPSYPMLLENSTGGIDNFNTCTTTS